MLLVTQLLIIESILLRCQRMLNSPTVSCQQHESRSPKRHSKPSNRTKALDHHTPVGNRSSIGRPWDKEFSPSDNTPARQIPASNK
ncbi:hypothetical protein ACF0H5_003278 [Mactra antiquata]